MYEYGVQIGSQSNDPNAVLYNIPAKDLDDLYTQLAKSFSGKHYNVVSVRVPGMPRPVLPQPKWGRL